MLIYVYIYVEVIEYKTLMLVVIKTIATWAKEIISMAIWCVKISNEMIPEKIVSW